MAAKLDAARRALDGGVGRVRIGDLAALRDPALGTSIVATSRAGTERPGLTTEAQRTQRTA
jgi:acetylglutamate kinase